MTVNKTNKKKNLYTFPKQTKGKVINNECTIKSWMTDYEKYKERNKPRYARCIKFSLVRSLSHFQLFATPWIATRQTSLSITSSQSLFKLMSIESVMPSNHLILCRPLLLLPSIFSSIRVFPNESVFASGGQSIGVSDSASDLSMNIQD